MGIKQKKQRTAADEEKPREKYNERLSNMVMGLRAATREEKLDEKVLLKMAQAWERHGKDPEMLSQHLVNIIANDAGYGADEYVLPVYNKVVAIIDREHKQRAAETRAHQTVAKETVLVAKASSRVTQAPVRKTSGSSHRVQAGGHKPSTTLGEALSLRPQLSKPRGKTTIDVLLWAGALNTAEGEIKQEFGIPKSLEEYYHGMCKYGKSLLADDLNKRTQRIYDVRASRKFVKEAKAFKSTRKLKKHVLDELD